MKDESTTDAAERTTDTAVQLFFSLLLDEPFGTQSV